MSPKAGEHAVDHVAVIFNPTKVDETALKAAVEKASTAAGWAKTHWYETTPDDAGQDVTKAAIAAGADVVVACGGDGTVRAVAEALVGTGIPLGLVPAGTGNLLARNLGMTLGDLDVAAQVVLNGEERPIDVGMVSLTSVDGSTSEHAFLVMAGVGIDAEMIVNTNPQLKSKVGWLAYVDAALRTAIFNKPFRLRYSLDGQPGREVGANGLMLANCGLLPANILLLPQAVIDDGVLDFVVIRPKGTFGWLRLGSKIVSDGGIYRSLSTTGALSKEGRKVRTLRYFRGETLVATVDTPSIMQLDGDGFGEVTGFSVSTRPGALTVRVAPAEPEASEKNAVEQPAEQSS